MRHAYKVAVFTAGRLHGIISTTPEAMVHNLVGREEHRVMTGTPFEYHMSLADLPKTLEEFDAAVRAAGLEPERFDPDVHRAPEHKPVSWQDDGGDGQGSAP